MKQENQKLLIRYLICIGIACAITFTVFAIQGFFTDDVGVNVQILADGFFVSGGLMTMFAGLMFVSGHGALLGVTFIFRNILLAWFVPGGRAKQEMFKDYRERKMSELKKSTDHCILFTGLAFLAVGLILTVIWYVKFYHVAS